MFYTQNQIADRFPSNDANGDNNYSTTYNGDDYSILNMIQGITHSYNAGAVQPFQVNLYSFRYSIRAVAGLLYWFAIETGILNKVTFKNNFNAGTIQFDQEILLSGNSKGLMNGDSHVLIAIPQTYNNYNYIWNALAPNARSSWSKLDRDGIPVTINNNSNISYNLNVTNQDIDATYTAGLRKNFKISRNDQKEFDGTTAAGVVTHIVEQNSGNVPVLAPFNLNGKSYRFGNWVGTSGDNFTPTNNTTLTAFYKYANHSNNVNAFASGSQRKVASYMWKVYESSGSIWLEKGNEVMNGGRPVNDLAEGPEAKSPSLDYNLTYNAQVTGIYVTYQQKISTGKYKIKLAKFNESGQRIFNLDVFTSTKDYTSLDAVPVIAVTHTTALADNKPKFVIVWRQKAEGSYQDGLYYYGGIDNGTNVTWYYLPPQKITSTDSQSSNPTIAVYKNPYGVILNHLAWQQGTTKIKYRGIYDNWNHDDAGGIGEAGSLEEPTAGIGITQNTNPSITVVNSNYYPSSGYDSPKLTWLASFGGQDYFVILRDKNNSQYGTLWNNSHLYYNEAREYKMVNINRTDLDNLYAFVFSDGVDNKYVKSTNLSSIQSLSTHVTDLQISNTEEGWTGMDIIAYNKSSLPYTFTTASTVIFKSAQTAEGRGGTVRRNNAEFYFGLGDVSIDDALVEFKEISDTLGTKTNAELNNYFVTIPFSLKDNSVITYSISYGVIDSMLAVNELKENESINFKVDLVDNSNGKILTSLNEITLTKNELKSNRNEYYKVNLTGLTSKEMKLRLVEKDNLNGEYAFSKIHSASNGLKKVNANEITLNEQLIIKEYALAQNYPNPFNPTTTINYQIPKDGLVTLKIYDVLGKEAATLVNEVKTTGRYNVDFNAGSLSSGVYLYQLKASEFVSTKKLILLK